MGKMKEQVYVVHEDNSVCILHVSGSVTSIDQVVDWVGGFICPKHDDGQQYDHMVTMPAGGICDDNDIFVILHHMPVEEVYYDVINTYANAGGFIR